MFTKEMFEPEFTTSYYARMAKRRKNFDLYIQVSRSVYCPMKDLDGEKVGGLIDINAGEALGNYSSNFKEYFDDLAEQKDYIDELLKVVDEWKSEIIQGLANELKVENNIDSVVAKMNEYLQKKDKETMEIYNEWENPKVFLLCFENLESRYKENDKDVKDGFVKVGDWKVCHRRIIAKFIEHNYNIKVPEYGIKKENEKTVYRDYF